MVDQRDIPTCELGFWEPLHSGCPVCGPGGPCIDPAYEQVIQDHAAAKRFKRTLLIISLIVCLAAVIGGLSNV